MMAWENLRKNTISNYLSGIHREFLTKAILENFLQDRVIYFPLSSFFIANHKRQDEHHYIQQHDDAERIMMVRRPVVDNCNNKRQ